MKKLLLALALTVASFNTASAASYEMKCVATVDDWNLSISYKDAFRDTLTIKGYGMPHTLEVLDQPWFQASKGDQVYAIRKYNEDVILFEVDDWGQFKLTHVDNTSKETYELNGICR